VTVELFDHSSLVPFGFRVTVLTPTPVVRS
jgi:hypothetical protein